MNKPTDEQSKELGKAYRYVDTLHSSGSEEYGFSLYITVYLLEYQIVKETPRGIWIEEYIGKKRFVNLSARKKFACVSKEDALISFRKRKERQIRILENQLRFAKEALLYSGLATL